MATAHKAKNWTSKHEDALSGLTGLGLNKKYAASLLENVPAGELSDMMNAALRSHARAKKPPVEVPLGGPKNAVPLKHEPAPKALEAPPEKKPAKPKPPSAPPLTQPPGPGEWSGAQMGAAPKPVPRVPVTGTPLPSGQWSASSMVPQAPISPAVAQLSVPSMAATNAPDRPAMPGPGAAVKPRIRVRAAGGPVPAAPLGTGAPSIEQGPPTEAPVTPTEGQQAPSAQAAPLPRIRSEEEYEKIAPGTRFVWIPDGHIYRKPAQPSQGGE